MRPTVGRIVHYQAPTDCGGEVYAGIVVAVRDLAVQADGQPWLKIDLVTFGPSSIYHNHDVPWTGDEPLPGAAFWPPRAP